MKAESTLFAIYARTKVAKIDYRSFALTKKGGRGILIENKRACGKKGLVLGVSVALPVTLLSRVPSYCCGMLIYSLTDCGRLGGFQFGTILNYSL